MVTAEGHSLLQLYTFLRKGGESNLKTADPKTFYWSTPKGKDIKLYSHTRGGIELASYVLLLKEYEDNETVVYRFGPNENIMGKIELNKFTGKFKNFASKFYFDRAAQRLAVCLVKEGGVFPERTAFES